MISFLKTSPPRKECYIVSLFAHIFNLQCTTICISNLIIFIIVLLFNDSLAQIRADISLVMGCRLIGLGHRNKPHFH